VRILELSLLNMRSNTNQLISTGTIFATALGPELLHSLMKASFLAILLLLLMFSFGTLAAHAAPYVELMQVPNGGIQPQAAIDSAGTVHLVYYKGDAKNGNLFYVKRGKDDTDFSKPLQVNSIEGSATSNGCISGGQMAIGKNGDIFVTWNASGSVPDRDHVVFFSRLVGDHSSFEKQRDLLNQPLFMDGGGSVAADENGNVYVFWHAWEDGKSEEDGRVFVAHSQDDGKTFLPARAIDNPPRGTCACCSMKSMLDAGGELRVLYRAAKHGTERDTVLLSSTNGGKSFQSKVMQSWKGNSCPMTMFSFSSVGKNTLAAWETPGKVNVSSVSGSKQLPRIEAGKSSKYPTIALNRDGDVLLSWVEKEAWNKAGQACWQTFDAKGKSGSKIMSKNGIDVWSFTAALPRPNGSFLLLY
jgi:hypothetical protein